MSPILLIVFAAIALAVFFAVVISRRQKKISTSEESFVRNQWRMIGLGKNPKNDIIEADKLLDFVLGKYGFEGSLGEKLKKAKRLFSDINGVWFAHKLRNKFAHEINFNPSEFEFRKALESFRKALIDLKINL
ncbi:MAG: hypothetical protein K9L85_02465 [Candidatus Peribacteraceae bacterium]|nr:hypothetical protein [Candidatus Peribacteraceae bacterium]